jgi:hypothetical protein
MSMSNVHFFVDDNNDNNDTNNNNNVMNYDEMDIDAQLASVLTEEEYNTYIFNKTNKNECEDDDNDTIEVDMYNIDIDELMLFYNKSNVKSLTRLLQYYDIYKPKMLKNEMIQVLVLFETQKENTYIVNNRMRLWRNIEELKADPFFGKYIMF